MSNSLSGRAVYAGSFDPLTYGHMDMIQRASRLFDDLIIGIGENPKKSYLFDIETRVTMVQEQISEIPNVSVQRFQNLLIDFAESVDANVILRGLRASTDFDYEFQIGLVNMNMNRNIETLFLLTDPKNIFISSSTVKEIAYFGGNLDSYVPPAIEERLREKFPQPSSQSNDTSE